MKNNDPKPVIKKIAGYIFFLGVIGTSISALFFVIAGTWIGHEVKIICQDAARKYDPDVVMDSLRQSFTRSDQNKCVDNLVLLVDDQSQSIRSRNDAIWALGMLGNSRALPVLQKYYTRNIPQWEPLDKVISQYELKKAVNLAGGGTNIAAFLWR